MYALPKHSEQAAAGAHSFTVKLCRLSTALDPEWIWCHGTGEWPLEQWSGEEKDADNPLARGQPAIFSGRAPGVGCEIGDNDKRWVCCDPVGDTGSPCLRT